MLASCRVQDSVMSVSAEDCHLLRVPWWPRRVPVFLHFCLSCFPNRQEKLGREKIKKRRRTASSACHGAVFNTRLTCCTIALASPKTSSSILSVAHRRKFLLCATLSIDDDVFGLGDADSVEALIACLQEC